MSAPSPPTPPPPSPAQGLTPAQIGAGVGAALTVLVLISLQGGPAQQGGGNLPPLLIGVLGGVGAIVGLVVGGLVGSLQRKGRGGGPAGGAGTSSPTTAPPAPADSAGRNGSPVLRAVAGLLALFFLMVLVWMGVQAKLTAEAGLYMAALAVLFGWYAVRGRKGLPQSLTRK